MRLLKIQLLLVFLIFFWITFSFAQSRRKSSNDGPSKIKLGYHDLTARDNALFNARISFMEGMLKLKNSKTDDYDDILDIYTYEDPEVNVAINPEMERVLEKASKAIYYHDMSKWVDDCYLLMGKAYFIQGKYEDAEEVFKYIVSEFKDGKKRLVKKYKKASNKKKKKKPARQTSYKKKKKQAQKKKKEKSNEEEEEKKDPLAFIKHQTIKDEAFVWLIKSYIALEQFTEAQSLMGLAKNNDKFDKDLFGDLFVVQAYYHLERNNMELAARSLEQGIPFIKKNNDKERYLFILGQLYLKINQESQALSSFEKVLSLSPTYEMEFNAKINIAKAYENQSSSVALDVRSILEKMAKDRKNIEYLDQIYYYIARVDLKDGLKESAISNLNKSVTYSIKNQKQKGLSFLKLGDIYYQDEIWGKAKQNYDSALAFLPKTYNDYDALSLKNTVLSDIVKKVVIIEHQDTLQHLYSLRPEERESLLDEVIEQRRKEDLQKAVEKQAGKQLALSIETNLDSEGDWYFYNSNSKKSGYTEFVAKWGKRALEDNWRRSNKQSISSEEEESSDEIVTNTSTKNYEQYKTRLLEETPKNEDELVKSKVIEGNATYDLASIYKQKINDNQKATDQFKKIIEESDIKGDLRAKALYNLYILYKEQKNESQAKIYSDLILKEFPNSIYATYIKNPNYFKDLEASKKEIERLYENAYEAYKVQKYGESSLLIQIADSLQPNNDLKPKFSLLNAMIIGKTSDESALRVALKDVIDNYPTDNVKYRARAILLQLDNKEAENIEQQNNQAKSIFQVDKEQPHYACILVHDSIFESKLVMNSLSNYNNKFHKLDKLSTDNKLMNKKTLLMVKEFKNYDKANSYLNEIKDNNNIKSKLKSTKHDFLLITSKNLIGVYKQNSFNEYLAFYKAKY